MKDLHRSLTLLVVWALPLSVSAEACWMVGCPNALGYVRVHKSDAGDYLPFNSKTFPAVGSKTTLCAFAMLRFYAIADLLGREDQTKVAGNQIGPGTQVKILDRVTTDNGIDLVAVRILEDSDKCPPSCGKCSGHY